MAINNVWTKEDNVKRRVEMPNEIFNDLSKWLEAGEIKSNMHQEFIYSYYWLTSYLWKYAEYKDVNIKQESLKQILGYNPNEKRLNYIIKKNGLLDNKKYTESIRDYPISWERKGDKGIEFFMYTDLSKDERKEYYTFLSNSSFVKSPCKSLKENIFNKRGEVHLMSGKIFKACMENEKLNCAGFFLLGYLTYLRNVSICYYGKPVFQCPNQTIVNKFKWSEQRITRITNELRDSNLIEKWQPSKKEGMVNSYKLLF